MKTKLLLLLIIIFSCSVLSYAQCTDGVWGQLLVNQTFGQGNNTDSWYGPLANYAPGATTSTTFVGTAGPVGGVLSDGYSGLAKVPSASGQGNWVSTTDHTGDVNGLMFLINAPSTAATVFFEYTMDNLCPNTTLKLSVWIINANVSSLPIGNPSYQYPNMTLKAVDAVSGVELGSAESGDVPADEAWHQYSVIFNNGTSSSITLQLINNSVGSGFGNDLAIDDITVQPCVPETHILPLLDTLVCQNATLDFTADVLNNPYSPAEYQWQYSTDGGTTWLDQGTPGSNTDFTFNAATSSPGTYLVRFKAGPEGATANDNCIAISDTSIITVSSPPVPPVLEYPADYCTGAEQQPFVIVSGTNLHWYDVPEGGTASTTDPVINTGIVGSYTWYVSQVTPQGCESDRIPVTVTVHQTPVPDFDSVIALGCSSDTVHLNNTSQYATGYEWNFGDGSAISNSIDPTHVYNAQGVYNIKLVAHAGMCADSITSQVDLNHPLHANFVVSDDTLCADAPFTITDFSTTTLVNGISPSYYWDFDDNSTSTSPAPTAHTYSQAGVYNMKLVITDGVPCSDTFIKTITVDSAATITVQQSDTMICTGDQVTLDATYTQDGFQDLLWVFGNNNDTVMNENPVSRAYDIAGSYSITAIAQYRACPAVNALAHIRVNPMPVINIGQDDSLCYLGNPILLVDSANILNPDARWQWSTGDTTGIVRIVHPGTYTASVDVAGCVTTDKIIIYKDCYIDIPNSFTPNGDGVNDYFFPRQFLSSGVIAFKMSVYNRWGQKIYETTNIDGRGWDGRFNGKDQPDGVYVYIVDVTMKNYRQEHYTGNVTLLR